MNTGNSHIDHGLLMQFLLGEATKSEQEKVQAWLTESEDNQRELDKLEEIWLEAGKLTPPPVVVDVKSAWNKMSARIDTEESKVISIKESPKRKNNMLRVLLRVAAVFLIGITLFKSYQVISDPKIQQIASVEEVVKDTLPDGSQIALNTNSTITYTKKFDKKVREVELKGEAFFDVERNEEKPFVIDAGIGKIKVLGTSFKVKAYPNSDLEVFVESGTVQLFNIDSLSGDTNSIILTAGMQGVISYENKELEEDVEIDENELFWYNRKLIFEHTKLCLVFDMLEEYYDVTIVVKDPKVDNLKLSASFDDDNIDEILEVIAISFDLNINYDEDTYLIEVNSNETK